MMNRVCRECNETKPMEEFELDKRAANGYRHRCKACRRKYRREHGSYFAERIRKYKLRHSDNVFISVEEIEALLQKETCSYCGCELNGKYGHSQQSTIDHVYGGINLAIVFAVCCRGCNSAKGRKHVYEFYQDSEKFTDELWTKFVRDFTERFIGRDINSGEVEAMKINPREEFHDVVDKR